MLQDSTARLPRAGEPVVLADGRRFVCAEIQNGVRGWWFLATGQDGASTLQGNLRLEWDSPARFPKLAASRWSNRRYPQ